jgi:peptidyl-prolyl cis-trans isomerase B (cyclophilin B)
MPNRRTRDRQLAKLASRRAAERRRKRRQRVIAGVLVSALVLGLGSFGLIALFSSLGKPKAASSATPTPSASASVSPAAATVACGGTVPKAASKKKPQYDKAPKNTIDPRKTYTMTMETSCGTIEIKLDQKSAPKTVNSLVFLAGQRFFDGQQFHRIVKGFVIQGGDPLTAGGNPPEAFGTGGPGYKTVDKPPAGAKYPPGTVAMAKGGSEPDGTAGSQFFIVTGAAADASLAPGGVGQYAIVGTVVKGLDVALAIEALPTSTGSSGENSTPVRKIYIDKVTVKVS